jgi:hypothetical protein
MATIETQDAAQRLARAILSDIKLYNSQKTDLSGEIEEGRQLFIQRAPRFAAIFEEELARSDLGGSAEAHASNVVVSPPPVPASGRPWALIAAVVLVLAGVIIALAHR